MRVGLWRKLSAEELMLLNCDVEKTLESPFDYKEIYPVNPKGDQSWLFIGRTDVEAKTPILWPPDVKNWLIWKIPWCWEWLKAGGEGAIEDAIMICSDFGAQKNSLSLFPLFPHLFPMKWWDQMPNKGPYSQSYGFSSSHVWMWELDYKKSWAPKNWCFWSNMLKMLKSEKL